MNDFQKISQNLPKWGFFSRQGIIRCDKLETITKEVLKEISWDEMANEHYLFLEYNCFCG